MSTLHIAVTRLLEANEALLDAFEAAVLDALPATHRRAVEGSEDGLGPDRTPLLSELMTHFKRAHEKIFLSNGSDAHKAALNGVKLAAAAISEKIDGGAMLVLPPQKYVPVEEDFVELLPSNSRMKPRWKG